MLVPTIARSGGATSVATITLMQTTMITVPAREIEQRPGQDEDRDEHREEEGAAGEDDRPPGGAAGSSIRPPAGVGAGRPAPRGSGRPSAGRSRPPGPGPSSCSRSGRRRRSRAVSEAKVSTPREVITVIAPKSSGISAATGERKTKQQDDQEHRQGDQLAALCGADRFVLDRPREAGEPGLGRATGAVIFLRGVRSVRRPCG